MDFKHEGIMMANQPDISKAPVGRELGALRESLRAV
jgi:hypothetical protein